MEETKKWYNRLKGLVYSETVRETLNVYDVDRNVFSSSFKKEKKIFCISVLIKDYTKDLTFDLMDIPDTKKKITPIGGFNNNKQ